MRHWAVALSVTAVAISTASAERIKDITEVQGVRGNSISGYGLVVGLNGTGDGSELSAPALANALRNRRLMNVTRNDLEAKNIAFVAVSATLMPSSLVDSKLDVTVSAVQGAASLQGGMLLETNLKGADGETYAVAAGGVAIGGFAAEGKASSITKNHVTVGRIPGGATVEREETACFVKEGRIVLMLLNPDFSTAQNIADAINNLYPRIATVDGLNVRVTIPRSVQIAEIARFIQTIGELQVKVDQPAVIVINERTGTIIVGENVGISTVGISHGNLSIITEERELVSQPGPLARRGDTVTVQRTDLRTMEEKVPLTVIPRQVSVSELARALNAMGLTPRDLISIFQALKVKGALQAELKIM